MEDDRSSDNAGRYQRTNTAKHAEGQTEHNKDRGTDLGKLTRTVVLEHHHRVLKELAAQNEPVGGSDVEIAVDRSVFADAGRHALDDRSGAGDRRAGCSGTQGVSENG